MPQFRILIAVMVDAIDFNQASFAGTDYVLQVRQRTHGPLVKDVRVLKVEDVSPPSLDVSGFAPLAVGMSGVDTDRAT